MATQKGWRAALRATAISTGIMAGGALPGCDVRVPQKATQTKPDPNRLVDVLSAAMHKPNAARFRWVDVNGQEVNLAALEQAMRGRNVTLSFGFQECELLCPAINEQLAHLGSMDSRLLSIVVAVDPLRDGKDQPSRERFLKRLRDEGVKQEVLLLFPVMEKEGKLVPDPDAAIEAQVNMGAIPNRAISTAHTSIIGLYQNGRLVAQESGLSAKSAFDAWKPALENARGR
jgi:hypothetical protein